MNDIREAEEARRLYTLLRTYFPPFSLGTFPTPPLLGGSTADGTATFTTQFGRYIRIGPLCFFRLTVVGNTRTVAATGDARIGPLPFTSANVTDGHVPVTIDTLNNINLLATTVQLSARIPPNTSYIEFIENPDNGAVTLLPAGSWVAASAIRISGWYEIA